MMDSLTGYGVEWWPAFLNPYHQCWRY